jgi:Peptidase C65 Otubain
MKTDLMRIKSELLKGFYDAIVLDDFWEVVEDKVFSKRGGLDESDDMYIISFFRCLVSAQIRGFPEKYSPFLNLQEFPGGLDEFCRQEIDPVNKEVDDIQIQALSDVLNCRFNIFHLSKINKPNKIVIGSEQSISFEVNLVYKPGHYDLVEI